MTAWPCDEIPPPAPGAIKAKFGLDLITCTPRDKIHVVYHRGEPLHYSRIRSFKIPTIPSPITTSLDNKTSLNIIFTQFCIFHIKTLIKTKFIRWTQPLIFVRLQRSWDHYRVSPIFLREFNFANGDFFVCFAGLIFAIGETVYSSFELIYAIFWKPPSIWNYNILVFWV